MNDGRITILARLLEGTSIEFERTGEVIFIQVKSKYHDPLDITVQYSSLTASVDLFGVLTNLDELDRTRRDRIYEYMVENFSEHRARGFSLFYDQYKNLYVHIIHPCKDLTGLSSDELAMLIDRVTKICDELWNEYLL